MTDSRVDVRRLARREQRKLTATRSQLQPLFSTTEMLADTYTVVAQNIVRLRPDNSPPTGDRAVSASIMLQFTRRTVVLEFLALGRRHWPESLLLRRRAMELMAFAWMCWRRPSDAHVWLEAGQRPYPTASRKNPGHLATNNDTQWDNYQRSFQTPRIRSALEELSPGMSEAYMRVSGFAHPSAASVVMAIPSHRIRLDNLLAVEFFDDHKLVRPGFGRALSAERMLDSLAFHTRLLRGFCDKALKNAGWDHALRSVGPDLSAVEARLRRDAHFYREEIRSLDAFRDRNIARISRARVRRRYRARRRD
jgi:hypothetical protein